MYEDRLVTTAIPATKHATFNQFENFYRAQGRWDYFGFLVTAITRILNNYLHSVARVLVSKMTGLLLAIPLRNKSPAVARVSRPYSWCTLATCVHNCPSMMFRTCCCLRPKCQRSYVLIYITSGSYANKLCKQVKRPIPPRNTCVANCGQTAAVSDMVTIDSL